MNSDVLLKRLGADDSLCEELKDYLENKFNTNVDIPEEIPEEVFVKKWREIIDLSKEVGISKALNDRLAHGDNDIILKEPDKVKLEIYKSVAGSIPIIYAFNESDFYELITKIIHKGKVMPNLERTGASFAFGLTNKFIILSNKPYSNIDAKRLGLDDKTWKDYSILIRREHECTHYFTKRFLGSSRNNLHDELIADFAGILGATGEYHADWFLIGMGLIEDENYKDFGRFPVYTVGLSDKAKDLLKKIIIKVAMNVEKWSKEDKVKIMNMKEKILFLCSKSLPELYCLYE